MNNKQDELNKKPSVIRLKEQLVSEIPYVPQTSEAKQFLLNHDIGDLLHIYHFWRQRLLRPVPRRYHAPSSIRNESLYLRHKAKIDKLKRKIEAGEDVSAYLSLQAHTKALDVTNYRETRSFNGSRDLMLVSEGFYHLHLAPAPERTDEILVAKVETDLFEVIGLFTHELFYDGGLNPAYSKYTTAVDSYLARKFPAGGLLMGGAGGGMQNAAGSSVASTYWQVHCRKVLSRVENYPDGISGFTIKLYDSLFGRTLSYVKPSWVVADDGRLLIRDRKNKHDFWMHPNGVWESEPCA